MLNSVSTSTLFAIPRNAVTSIEKQLGDAETETTTGFLANPVESLGSQIGLDETLQAQSTTLSNFQTTNGIAQSTLTATQNVLTSLLADAQSFTNALITAQNPTQSSSSLGTLMTNAQSYLESLTAQLNTNTGGSYIFAGINSSVAPVTDYTPPQTATWSTTASSTPMTALIAPGQSVTISASANDPSSCFENLYNAYAQIVNQGTSAANLTAAQTLVNKAMSGITNLQSTLGISQSQITNVNNQMQTQETFYNNWVIQLQGVSSYQAATNLTNLTTQLETAYSLTDRLSKLSLVNYLSA